METAKLYFSANGQQLTKTGERNFASNTVNFIEAFFDLGDNWTGFAAVRAVWHTDFSCISTVLDSDGRCLLPHEVLKRTGKVKVNLVGSITDGEVLTDRLTTYPVVALVVDANARICGTETAEITPDQFEQFVEIVKDEVDKIKDVESVELNPDYTLTIKYSDGTEDTVGPIRGEKGETGPTGPPGPPGNGIESIELTGTSGAVKTYTITFTDGNTTTFQVTDGEVTLDELAQLLPTETASGQIASFPDGQAVIPMQSLKVTLDPIQDLSHGEPSPENICPISGHDEVDVEHTGKNLVDSSNAISGLCAYQAGQNIDYVVASTRYSHSVPINAEDGLAVTFRSNDISTFYVILVECFDSQGNWVYQYNPSLLPDTTTTRTVIVPANTYKWVRLAYSAPSGGIVGTDIDGDVMCVSGSTATDYEPYNGTTYTTTLPSTTYGGTLDVVSGVLTVMMGIADLGTITPTMAQVTQGNLFRFAISNIKAGGYVESVPNIKCEAFPTVSNQNRANHTLSQPTGQQVVDIIDNDYSDVTSFKTAMDGIHIVYELATPQTYQLTPQQIQTLLGQNNVWSDAGEVEVTYNADVQLYIGKLIGTTEDDYIADTAIPNGAVFSIGDRVFKATATIARGETIVPGTNCTETSITEQINSLYALV